MKALELFVLLNVPKRFLLGIPIKLNRLKLRAFLERCKIISPVMLFVKINRRNKRMYDIYQIFKFLLSLKYYS